MCGGLEAFLRLAWAAGGRVILSESPGVRARAGQAPRGRRGSRPGRLNRPTSPGMKPEGTSLYSNRKDLLRLEIKGLPVRVTRHRKRFPRAAGGERSPELENPSGADAPGPLPAGRGRSPPPSALMPRLLLLCSETSISQ